MKTKTYLFLISLLTAITGYAYDFEALNTDGVPIYYNFNEDGTSVAVTYGEKFFSVEYSGNVVIPESVIYNSQSYPVTAIGEKAFYECFDLTNVTIPESVTTIGNEAFMLCYNLNNIIIPNNVTTIGNNAFSACQGLTNISIPNNVITIGDGAFAGCVGLTTVTIGENVTDIGAGAFYACDIINIFIPENITTIGDGAFNYCLSLNKFIVSEQNENYSTIDGVLFNKDQTVLIAYPNAKSSVYIIPDGISTIGPGAFRLCKDLMDITIPTSVTTIELSAFLGTKLSNVIIPESVTTIGDYVFCVCRELKKVTVPNNDISFGDHVFDSCDALDEIHNLSYIPQSIGRFSFTFVDKDRCKLFVPKGSLNDYKTADVWKEFKNIIETDYVSVTLVNKENISILPIEGGISIICNDLVQVAIFSITGREVYQSTFRGCKDIPLEQGLYIARINGENRKIIVK